MPDSHCSVTIAGTEDEVMPLAMHHSVTMHGLSATAETEEMLRENLVDEKSST